MEDTLRSDHLITSGATLIWQPDLPYGSFAPYSKECTDWPRSLYCDNFGDAQRQPNPVRELNVGVLAERSDGFVLLSHEVADCPASPWPCGVGALAGQIGDVLASCGPGQRILVPIHLSPQLSLACILVFAWLWVSGIGEFGSYVCCGPYNLHLWCQLLTYCDVLAPFLQGVLVPHENHLVCCCIR